MTDPTFDLIDTVLDATANLGAASMTIDAQTLTFADNSWLSWTVTDTAWSMITFTSSDDVISQAADTTHATLVASVTARAQQMAQSASA